MDTTELRPPLTPEEVAERYGVHVSTVARWRREGSGPKFKKIGPRQVRYPISAVIEWENTGLHSNTASSEAAK